MSLHLWFQTGGSLLIHYYSLKHKCYSVTYNISAIKVKLPSFVSEFMFPGEEKVKVQRQLKKKKPYKKKMLFSKTLNISCKMSQTEAKVV